MIGVGITPFKGTFLQDPPNPPNIVKKEKFYGNPYIRQKSLCNGVPIFIKREQTIEKTPNFAKIILITCASHRQIFNAVACFLLELLGHQWLLLCPSRQKDIYKMS